MSVCPVYNRQIKYGPTQAGTAYISTAPITVDIYLRKTKKKNLQKLPAEIPLFFKGRNFFQNFSYFLKRKRHNNQISTIIGAVDKAQHTKKYRWKKSCVFEANLKG